MQRRGAKSFVDDLVLSRGVVLSRAAASLRSIETKPFDWKICPLWTGTSPTRYENSVARCVGLGNLRTSLSQGRGVRYFFGRFLRKTSAFVSPPRSRGRRSLGSDCGRVCPTCGRRSIAHISESAWRATAKVGGQQGPAWLRVPVEFQRDPLSAPASSPF